MRAQGLGAAALLLITGCAAETKLRPTPEAGVLRSGEGSAITEQAGVKLVADGSAWRGHPSDLERRLTPVYVRLENQGERPLKLQYRGFALIGQESRFRYTALAPLSLQKAMSSNDTGRPPEGVIAPAGRWSVGVGVGSSYGYGPRRGYGPPYYGPWGSPFYSPYLYAPAQCQEPLPTEDMLNNALPEGTLEPGGMQQGFLYFQGVASREDAVTLQVKLVDAGTGEPFGALDIPFQVSTR
ncbi:hypothetical protein OV208_35640 [Corallococcus sp. bb12-1]|uniref:hypothetical protein n=1 Tax=Corallococcus sp. bb12-1 TaxID=2996784 RepID=UPI00226DA848|nr:hypothetical protein [Corallococcus sp. bb12-1]MCY1046692.1 hypothetical protein [Corallococcus sp. bb12-1]